MELGSIEREIFVDASPEVVFEVVSSPEHIKGWWPDDADYQAVPGSTGTISFGEDKSETFTVVAVEPPTTFSFRWTHPVGVAAAVDNSLLVTFDLTASGGGTLVRMTETGFRERGWSQAALAEQYQAHVTGWDFFLPRLAPYAGSLQVRK
ncbi:SRPBCC family protein [Actinoplanes awajinensis]|uniref:Polyketide cyclase n=1 Tax=Actinoplanes awajinensis subsp. mycoplanecinus TaxID=135947 RepID=A0A117MRL4_9ACTN|nr:SRPBCC family protein [Actinoplanes awajinensis]KUL31962.1 polyketide cyclase [Actinoplanes awajinensis subsp. mycoplanecinus]